MATTAQLSENSHPGFEGIKAALCLAEMDAKSNSASGMQPCLRRNGTGSRCSGKERDAESGLDYFGARYYSGPQGRFTSPDQGKADLSNPQSWNRYTYTFNNPLRYVDPDGKWPQDFHYRLIHDNFGHYGAEFEKALRKANDWVDSGPNQLPERAFMHGMTDGVHHQTKEQAMFASSSYITSELDIAINEQLRFEATGGHGFSYSAIERFGRALHAATDPYALQHSWKPWNGMNSVQALLDAEYHRDKEIRSVNSPDLEDALARYDAYVAARTLWYRYQKDLERRRKEQEEEKSKMPQ